MGKDELQDELELVYRFMEDNKNADICKVLQISLLSKLEQIRFEISDIAFSLREGLKR
jgi:hypothetical protein